MKRILRVFVIEGFVLYLISQITTGLNFEGGIQGLIAASVALGIASFFVKPIINVLLLPLNLLTFGLLKFVGNAITLFLVDLVLNQFKVGAFNFNGVTSPLIDIPSLAFPEGVLSYIAFSALISLVTTVIYWFVT